MRRPGDPLRQRPRRISQIHLETCTRMCAPPPGRDSTPNWAPTDLARSRMVRKPQLLLPAPNSPASKPTPSSRMTSCTPSLPRVRINGNDWGSRRTCVTSTAWPSPRSANSSLGWVNGKHRPVPALRRAIVCAAARTVTSPASKSKRSILARWRLLTTTRESDSASHGSVVMQEDQPRSPALKLSGNRSPTVVSR